MLLRFRFRLATLFALTSVIALGLAFCQRYMRVPMRTGAAYVGICYASDWAKLASSRPAETSGDFETCVFNVTEPDDLVKDFSSKPQLWCINIADEVGRYAVDRKSFLAVALMRSRPADRPVEGRPGSSDFSHDVMDLFGVVGTFEEARLPPRRFMIDCRIDSRTNSNGTTDFMAVSRAATGDRARLRYTGPAPEGLLVFSRAISEQLVELVIFKVR